MPEQATNTPPTAEEAKRLHAELSGLIGDFRKTHDHVKAEREKFGKESEALRETVEKQTGRLDEIEERLTEYRLGGKGEKSADPEKGRAAFDSFLRKGVLPGSNGETRSVEVQTRKALDLGTPASAGVLQDDDYLTEIQKTVLEFSPVRRFARVLGISTTAIDIPRRTQAAAAAWIGETATRTETTNPNYDLVNIPAYELYARMDVSVQLLEDSEFNLETEMAVEFGEQMGIAEGTAFVNGAGTASPLGFLDTTDGIDTVAMGAVTLDVDDLFALFYGVKSAYAARGAWMLNRSTLPLIRAFEASVGGYLWAPGITAGDPPTILGRPYAEATDFPEATAGSFALNAKPIAFGDWRRAYTIADRVGVSIQRDPYSLAASGQVRFIGRKRVGGKPMLTEAAKVLQAPAA